MRNLRMFFALLMLCLGVLWGGVEPVLAQSNPIQPSTWGGIKAMCGQPADQQQVSPPTSDTSEPKTADEVNALGRAEAQKLLKTGRHTVNGYVLYVDVPFYSQKDGSWACWPLGYAWCGSTIGSGGCLLSCIAMHYAKWGYREVTPKFLNDWSYAGQSHYAFSAAGCGDLIHNTQAIQYPGICRPYREISANQVWNELAAGHPVVARTNQYRGGHFVVIYGHDGYRYWVKDPMKDWTQQNQPLTGNPYYPGPFRVYGY